MYDFYEIPLKLKRTNHHNPLFVQERSNQSFDAFVNYLLRSDFPKEKIIVGIELYARTYTIYQTNSSILGSTVKKEGKQGKYTQINGILSYFEICELSQNQNWTYNWLNEEQVPYLFDGNDQIAFFEDWDSIEAKATYVKSNGLGGMSFFSLDMDDFTGNFCNQGFFPLVNTAKDTLDSVKYLQIF